MDNRGNGVYLLILSVIIVGQQNVAAETCTDLEVSRMLSMYSREEEPSDTNVAVRLNIYHASIDEKHSALHLIADVQMSWSDNHLNFTSSLEYCNSIYIEAKRIWLPDLDIAYYGRIMNTQIGDTQLAKVWHNGSVVWAKRLDVTVPCSLDLSDWPMDTQECYFKLGSRRHSSSQLALIIENSDLHVWEAGAWKVTSISGAISTQEIINPNYDIAIWTVLLKRHCPSHAIATSIVFTAAVIQIITAALLSPNARVPLYACVALCVTIWLMAALVQLPGTSSAPITLQLMAVLLILACVGALAAALVQRIARLHSPPPLLLRRLLTKVAVVFAIMPDQSTVHGEVTCAWVAAATFADHVLRIVGAIALIVTVCVYMFT